MGTLSTGDVSIQPTQSVTVKQEFECAYFLESEDKKVDINAHRYRIEVSVRRTGGVYNRIVEFSELQNLLKSVLPDRKYLYTDDPGTVSYIIGQLLETKDVSKSAVKLKFELYIVIILFNILFNLLKEISFKTSLRTCISSFTFLKFLYS